MDKYSFHTVPYDSDLYWKSVRLREIELRLPLGLRFSIEELNNESSEQVFVLCNAKKSIVATMQYIVEENTAKMRQVAVVHALQNKGLGEQLYFQSEAQLIAKGIVKIYCHVRLTAYNFYQKCGYSLMSEEFIEVGLPHVKMEKLL